MTLNISQRNSVLCQIPDGQIFSKVFRGLKPLNIYAKSSKS